MDKFVIRKKRTCTAEKSECIKSEPGGTLDPLKPCLHTFKPTHYTNPAVGHQVAGNPRAGKLYAQARDFKLAQQRAEQVSRIFQGVRVYVNGYVGTDDHDFRQLVMKHGGDISTNLKLRSVTHMICTSLSGIKTDKFLRGSANVKIVRPDWIMDCVEQGKRVPEGPYKVILDEARRA
ncbi:hypothetical protein PhCBS80983_g02336 [Powellomyces hirtus]|uniref:BRCT domain-containing protein n=1 Tax=Powellomyces hirtus TaxID=109895 RepID=A0A507E694_9FUNG|nr:hypothetical protein PhCBS80983_g02336 [Powellomyces hirtus]